MQFDIRQAIVTNWPIKLTALALATVLWVVLSAEQPGTRFIPVRLDVQTPADRVLAKEIPQVQVLVGGAARELLKLYTDPPVISKIVPDSVTESTLTIELSLQDVILPPNADVTLQELMPRRVVVTLDDLHSRSVPIVSRVSVEPASGFVFLGLRVLPESVSVIGPEAQVNRIGNVYTVALDLENVRSTVRRAVAIDTTAFGVVRLSQPEVEIEARIDRITQRTIGGVPVVIGGGVWGSEPATVQVAVRGPASRLATLNRDSLLVTANAATVEGEMLALSVRAPPGLTATISPDSVRAQRIIQ
jgi:YbbR domain-containing protein